MEPPALKNSHLASILQSKLAPIRFSLTIGVFPMDSSILFKIFIIKFNKESIFDIELFYLCINLSKRIDPAIATFKLSI